MKRLILGLAVAAAATFAAPASAESGVQWCGFTPALPCGVCVDEVGQCAWWSS